MRLEVPRLLCAVSVMFCAESTLGMSASLYQFQGVTTGTVNNENPTEQLDILSQLSTQDG